MDPPRQAQKESTSGRATWANGAVSIRALGPANPQRSDTQGARAGYPPWENGRVPRHGRYASASRPPSAPPPEGYLLRATVARLLLPVAPTRAHPSGSRDAIWGNIPVPQHARF